MSINGQYEVKVEAFRRAMITQFDANQNRGGWRGHEMKFLFQWLRDNVDSLERAVLDDNRQPVDETLDLQRMSILSTAADVANMALIIADNANALRYDGINVDGEKSQAACNTEAAACEREFREHQAREAQADQT